MIPRFHTAFAVVATLVVGAALAWGFILVGSPATRRLERFDEQRLRDLQTIARQIQSMVEDPNEKGKLKAPLPPTLDEAARQSQSEQLNLRDPETDAPYGYRVNDDATYELCATFSQPRDSNASVFWNHPAGEHCFTINPADPPPFW